MKVNKGELIVPALMAAFIAAYYWQVRDIPSEVLIWPGYITVALAVLLVLVMVSYAFRASGEKTQKDNLRRPFLLVLFTSAYLVAMKYTGFSLGSFVYLFGIQIYLGSRRKRAFFVALSVALFLHFVMVIGLGLGVPRLNTPWFKL